MVSSLLYSTNIRDVITQNSIKKNKWVDHIFEYSQYITNFIAETGIFTTAFLIIGLCFIVGMGVFAAFDYPLMLVPVAAIIGFIVVSNFKLNLLAAIGGCVVVGFICVMSPIISPPLYFCIIGLLLLPIIICSFCWGVCFIIDYWWAILFVWSLVILLG